ncbi:MAG: cysteine--tRNA ligase [Acidobacteria bacterium]|nr:cysteine--tRNA ligase [Acidobacteriota bacterium]
MTITLYDTLTQTKKPFSPVQAGKVSLYACGVTVYDLCHIGHAMQAIIYDVIRRYLEFRGFEVIYVRNYTDVDDKIIQRAQERGMHPLDLSAEMIQACESDLDLLEVQPATHSPKVSEFMPQITQMIETLIQNGHAYAASGDVYFRVRSFGRYGCLSNRRCEDLQAGSRVEVNPLKEDPMDFALWKSAKPGEVSWSSPWGEGRPGWHIECSAMAVALLGETFDIHGGGKDLIFPHHENEIAQSECATGKPFANYWIHNGLLTVDGRKMSKSLNNFLTIRDAVAKYHPHTIRYAILSHQYGTNIDFSEKVFYDAYQRLIYLYTLLAKLQELEDQFPDVERQAPAPEDAEWVEKFRQAMDDDFNSAAAFGVLSAGCKAFNDLLAQSGKLKNRAPQLLWLGRHIREYLGIFGLAPGEPKTKLAEINQYLIRSKGLDVAWVEDQIAERQALRQNKKYEEADQVRQRLIERGVLVMDTPNGTTWQVQP